MVHYVGPNETVITFTDLDRYAEAIEVEKGLLVRTASLDDVIRMKEAADRMKDHQALPELRRLREMLIQNSSWFRSVSGLPDRIFRLALLDLLPGALDLHSYSRIDDTGDGVRVLDDRLLVCALSTEQRSVLRWKSAGLNDGQIRNRLGSPRRTATYWKSRVYAIVEETLGPFDRPASSV
jgi:hypothetical protein